MLRDPACSLSARNLTEPEIVDPRPVTHVAELAARPRMCLQVGSSGRPAWPAVLGRPAAPGCWLTARQPTLLFARCHSAGTQEHGELPRDVTRLFADKLFKLDLSFVPQVSSLRRQLLGGGAAAAARRLPLWRPPLEVPFPPLQPAVFPPAFREPPPPALELFDLDEELQGPLVGGWLY